VIRSYVIWSICGLKTSKISTTTSFWWRHQITSPKYAIKMMSQKFFVFKPTPLAKSWLRPWRWLV